MYTPEEKASRNLYSPLPLTPPHPLSLIHFADSQSVKDNQGLLGPHPDYEVSKRLYGLGQFSKFIRYFALRPSSLSLSP